MFTRRLLLPMVFVDCTVDSVLQSPVSLSIEVSISVCTIHLNPSFSPALLRVTFSLPSCSDGSSQRVQVSLLTLSTLSVVVWYFPPILLLFCVKTNAVL